MVPTGAKSGARYELNSYSRGNVFPKTATTHFHAQLTLTDKGRANKRLVA